MNQTIFCDDSIFGDPTLSPEGSSVFTFSGRDKYCLCLLGEGQKWNKCAEQGRNCSCAGGIVRYVLGALSAALPSMASVAAQTTSTPVPTATTPAPSTTTPAPATTKKFSWDNVTNLWDCTFCPPGSQANTECVDGKTNDTTNEIVKRPDCTAIKTPKDCKKMDDKLQCCICGTAQQTAGVGNYNPPAQTSCTT